jgi:hypothetical protein
VSSMEEHVWGEGRTLPSVWHWTVPIQVSYLLHILKLLSPIVFVSLFYFCRALNSSLDMNFTYTEISSKFWSRSLFLWKCSIVNFPPTVTPQCQGIVVVSVVSIICMPLLSYIVKYFFYIPPVVVVW